MKNLVKVNEYLANLGVLNVKLHDLHFNVVGSQFVPVHEFLEKVYDEMFEYYDAVGEHLKMKGEQPVVSLAKYLEIASVKETLKASYDCREALEIVLADLQLMKDLAIEIREGGDEEGNFILVGMMEDHVAYYEKQIWFIKSTLA